MQPLKCNSLCGITAVSGIMNSWVLWREIITILTITIHHPPHSSTCRHFSAKYYSPSNSSIGGTQLPRHLLLWVQLGYNISVYSYFFNLQHRFSHWLALFKFAIVWRRYPGVVQLPVECRLQNLGPPNDMKCNAHVWPGLSPLIWLQICDCYAETPV